MHTNLSAVSDHPAALLDAWADRERDFQTLKSLHVGYAAAMLRQAEEDRAVTFVALGDDALARVQEEWASGSLVAFRDAVGALLGLKD